MYSKIFIVLLATLVEVSANEDYVSNILYSLLIECVCCCA